MLKKYAEYAKNLGQIAWPIILGNLGFIMIGVGDVIVAGRHSTNTLAAISLATAITHCILMFGIGILTSLSAVLSNYRGEGKNIENYFYPAAKFAMLLALITSIAIFAFIPVIDKLGFEPNLVPMIKDYFFVTGFATFGGYIHCMAKEYLQAFEIVVFPNMVTIFCIFLNLALNIIFVFGFGPIPEMGVIGLAIASLIVRYVMGLVLVVYCFKKIMIKYHKDYKFYKDLTRVGLPSSAAVMIEFIGFNIIAVLMGRVSGIYAAAHNIICTLTSVSFMVPLAISNATAVKVGFSNGAKDFVALKNYARTGIGISVCFMTCSAIVVGLCPVFLTKLFTEDIELIKVCVPVVYILCFFQVFDGLQVTLAGIFRGLKKTKVVMVANFIAYWIVAFPIGCVLAFKFNMNLLGFWYSLWFSAVIACTIMSVTLAKRFKTMRV